MKRLLVPLLGDPGDRPALDLAGGIAKRRSAHIDAVLFRRDPRDMIPLVGEGFNAAMIDSIMEAGEVQSRGREAAARATFADWSRSAGLVDGAAGGRPSASYSVVVGNLPGAVVRPARAADLVVFGRAKPEESQERAGLVESALLDSGRPVLLAGAASGADAGRRVLVAWNGSAEAARAVAMAMPLLIEAEAVTVVVVDDGDVAESPDELVRTLGLSGVNVSGKKLQLAKEGVAATLEAEAKASGADLILLGAYSHSRVREFVFGGVTDDALADGAVAMMLAH